MAAPYRSILPAHIVLGSKAATAETEAPPLDNLVLGQDRIFRDREAELPPAYRDLFQKEDKGEQNGEITVGKQKGTWKLENGVTSIEYKDASGAVQGVTQIGRDSNGIRITENFTRSEKAVEPDGNGDPIAKVLVSGQKQSEYDSSGILQRRITNLPTGYKDEEFDKGRPVSIHSHRDATVKGDSDPLPEIEVRIRKDPWVAIEEKNKVVGPSSSQEGSMSMFGYDGVQETRVSFDDRGRIRSTVSEISKTYPEGALQYPKGASENKRVTITIRGTHAEINTAVGIRTRMQTGNILDDEDHIEKYLDNGIPTSSHANRTVSLFDKEGRNLGTHSSDETTRFDKGGAPFSYTNVYKSGFSDGTASESRYEATRQGNGTVSGFYKGTRTKNGAFEGFVEMNATFPYKEELFESYVTPWLTATTGSMQVTDRDNNSTIYTARHAADTDGGVPNWVDVNGNVAPRINDLLRDHSNDQFNEMPVPGGAPTGGNGQNPNAALRRPKKPGFSV